MGWVDHAVQDIYKATTAAAAAHNDSMCDRSGARHLRRIRILQTSCCRRYATCMTIATTIVMAIIHDSRYFLTHALCHVCVRV